MSARLELDYGSIEELEEKISQLPGNVEEVINTYLHNIGVEKTEQKITPLIPVSDRRGRGMKRHARHSNWSKADKENLGFTVKARGGAANKRGSFGYLVFPDQGRGIRNPVAQEFMERGLDQSVSPIVEDLLEEITIKMEEGLR